MQMQSGTPVSTYGTPPSFLPEKAPLNAPAPRERLNVVAAMVCLIGPWLIYCFVYALLAFDLHYQHTETCFMLVGLLAVVVMLIGHMAWMTDFPDQEKSERWWTFAFLTSAAAWVLGLLLGRLTYWNYMQPYYNYVDLGEYNTVDPSLMKGEQFMDAGRISFVNATGLDLRRSMGFRNVETYCVAPITVDGLRLSNYDFWAVGMGCCSSQAADFKCGDFNNPNALSGLRLMDDTQRQFYRLAVDQAEATYQIKANHPLFFHWTQDAGEAMQWIRDEGFKYYVVGMLVHFGWQFFCVLLALTSSCVFKFKRFLS
jgi:hypothetical protein